MDKAKISQKKLKITVQKTLWFLARNAFMIILILVLLSMAIAEFLFYNYTLLTEVNGSNVKNGIIKLDDNSYNSVMEELIRREEILQKVPEANYINPFYK